jgi:hypothetical protein
MRNKKVKFDPAMQTPLHIYSYKISEAGEQLKMDDFLTFMLLCL